MKQEVQTLKKVIEEPKVIHSLKSLNLNYFRNRSDVYKRTASVHSASDYVTLIILFYFDDADLVKDVGHGR